MVTLHEDQSTFIINSSVFFKWERFQTKVVGEIKTHVLCPIFFSSKILPFRDSVEKYTTVTQATDENMAQSHFMPITSGYKRILRIRNTYCFSTTTMDLRKPLYITFIRTLPLLLAMALVVTNKCLWRHNHECHSFDVTAITTLYMKNMVEKSKNLL